MADMYRMGHVELEEKLRTLMARGGYTRLSLANTLGVTKMTMSYWLSGKRNPCEDNLKHLDSLGKRWGVRFIDEQG